MELKPGLQRVGVLNVEATRQQAEQAGFTAFVLPARGIVDRESFFNAVRSTFPLDPPLVGAHSWDALSDSLWEGLYAHGARHVAILWPGARVMANAAPSDFDTALDVLTDVANLLADRRATLDNPKQVVILVEGPEAPTESNGVET